jgi:sodium transport system ATP-binding protein
MIELKNIVKKFEKLNEQNKKITLTADNDISFEVKEGEVVGLLGPNGAGKTTLLRIIAGIMQPNEGTLTIDEMDYKHNEIEIKKQISFLSGNTKLYKELSPLELMHLCADYYKVDKKIVDKRIDEIVKRFNMESFKNQRIGTLSTGQTQRVGIARCLVHDPKYYIFDEATSGLDIISSKVILDFINEEKKNKKGILYSTHYMEEAENICDRVILLNKGRIIASGTPEKILKDTKTDNLRDAFFALIGDDKNE